MLIDFKLFAKKNYYQEYEEKLNKYFKELSKEKVIDQKLRFQIQSKCSSLSVFYGLPKVHRIGYPLRAIISTIGSYQYELSKYLGRAIRCARPHADSYVKDSFDFVKKIKSITLDKENSYIICTFDVEKPLH